MLIVSRRRKKLLLSFLNLCFALQVAPGMAQSVQRASPENTYTLKVDARAVNLDVVVTDLHGRLVRDLTRADFSVFDNGIEQKIDHYSTQMTRNGPSRPPHCAGDCLQSTSGEASITILVIDEDSMHLEDQAFADDSLRRFLTRQAPTLSQPTMLVAVQMRKLQVLHEYTTSRDQLLLALKHRFETSVIRPPDSNGFEDQVNASLSALIALSESAMGRPGHKNVIWVGRGFPSVTPGALDPASAASMHAAVQTCINLMTQVRMSLYTIDPRGLSPYTETDDGGNPARDPLDGPLDFALIARSTGGKAFAGRNDVDKLIATSTEEGESFYTLGYIPSASSTGDRAFHSIRVAMHNRQWKATTRQGYYTTPPAEALDAISSSPERDRSLYDLDVAARTTLVYNGVPFQIARHESDPDMFTISIPASAIQWKVLDDGELAADVALLAESFDRKGSLLQHSARLVTAHRSTASSPSRLDILTQIPTAPPAVRLRFVVRVEGTGRVGADNFSVASEATTP